MQIKRPLLGDKGRWLTTGDVAMQLVPILPLLAQMILLCCAKIPGEEKALKGKKQVRVQKVFNIVTDQMVVFRMQVVTILMMWIFIPLYEAMGLQEHTQYGGEDGIVAAYRKNLATLDLMVERTEIVKNKKYETLPSTDYFDEIIPKPDVTDADSIVLEEKMRQEIVSHIATVRLQLTKRFERLNALKYRAADITEEVFVVIEELCAYVKVPTAAAIRAARNRLIEYDNMPARAREEQPNEIRLLFEPGTLRQQLEEFSKGDINDLTEQPLPLRHWPELDAHLGHFIRFRLASSAYCEGRFSIASNAARTRPNSTTKTLSGFVRRRSNAEATEYPSIILFTDLDPSWDNTKSPPELKKRMTRRTVSRARSFDTDFERLAPQAKQALEPMKKIYLADFTASFAKKHAAALPAPEAAGNDSSADEAEEEEDDDDDDDDVALSFLSAAPVRLGGTSEKGAADVHSRTWKRNGKAVQYDEEFGERLPDDDPLANRKANFVWEDTDNGIVVMLSGPKPKPPENTSAAKAHGVPLRKLKFYTQMRVQDEFGEIYSFDLREDASSEMAVVYYFQ